MNKSIRQRIVEEIGTRLSRILVANGYETDLGKSVTEWRAETIPMVALPAVDYRDVSESSEASTIMGADSLREQTLSVHIEMRAADDPTMQRAMLADCIKAIGQDPTWAGYALATEIASDSTEFQEQSRLMGSTTLKLLITYRVRVWDPYNQ